MKCYLVFSDCLFARRSQSHNVDYPSSHDLTFTYDGLNQMVQMTDGAGTTAFSYDADRHVASEDGPWASDTISYTYTNGLRQNLTIQQPYATDLSLSYAYDSASRLTTISAPAGSFGY